MASDKTISIGFKIENSGQEGFKRLTLNAKEFEGAMKKNIVASDQLHKKIIDFGQMSQRIDSLKNSFDSLRSTLSGHIEACDAQIEAERQLEQVMKNTMAARDEDIQSIKDFCSAQQ